MAGATNDVEDLMKGSEGAKAADYANYFSSYAYIYHQKQMLSDGARMRAYRDAILGNPKSFEGKVVLDVGAGSGILSMWAAQAGAKRVIACEFTSMADHAEKLVAANGLSDIVEVRRSAVETLDLKKGDVDVIVSEWMGYFLLRESMLDSVIYARDNYLKDGGALFPNRAALFWAPTALHKERDAKLAERAEAMADWDAFSSETTSEYGVDVSSLRGPYAKEQDDFYLKQAQWMEMRDEQLASPPCCVGVIDLNTCTLAESAGIEAAPFRFPVPLDRVAAFAGWFDCYFEGSPDEPCEKIVTLATAPADGYTHWGQQVFFVPPAPVADAIAESGGPERGPSSTAGLLTMRRQKASVRLYDVSVALEIEKDAGAPKLYITWELP